MTDFPNRTTTAIVNSAIESSLNLIQLLQLATEDGNIVEILRTARRLKELLLACKQSLAEKTTYSPGLFVCIFDPTASNSAC